MDFSTITEIYIPIVYEDGQRGDIPVAELLDVNGQTLWTAEVPWTPLWRGSTPQLSFTTSASITTITPNTTWGVPSLPIKNNTDPLGSFELRVLLDLKPTGKMYVKTATGAGGRLLGELTGGLQYTDIPIVVDVQNTSRDVYTTSSMNLVGFTTRENVNIANSGNAAATYPLVIGSTYYSSGTTKYLRLTVKTYKPETGAGISQCRIKGIDYRRI